MCRKNFSCLRFLNHMDTLLRYANLKCIILHSGSQGCSLEHLLGSKWPTSMFMLMVSPSTTCQTPYNSSISITFTQFHLIVLYMLSYLGSHHHLNYFHSISCTRMLFYNNIMYFIHFLPRIEPDLHQHYDLHFFYKRFFLIIFENFLGFISSFPGVHHDSFQQ